MFRILTYMCWQTKNKNMFRISVRHCSKWFRSRLKNVEATGKKIIFLWSSINQMVKLNWSKVVEKEILQIFKQAQARENV